MRIGIALWLTLTLCTAPFAQEAASPEAITPGEIQSRVMALSRAELGPVTPLPPFGGDPGPVVVRMSNPFDREITISARLITGEADWTMAPPVLERMVPPMTSLEVSPEIVPPESDAVIAEPVMEMTVTVPTGTGDTVVATVPRTMAWISQVRLMAQTRAERAVDGYRRALEGWEAARAFEPRAWEPGVSNPSDPPIVVKYGWEGQDRLHLFLRFEDDDLVDNPNNSGTAPQSDALIIRGINAQGERRDFAIFPYRGEGGSALVATPGSPESEWSAAEGVEIAARHHNAFETIQLWEIGFPLTALFGPGLTSADGVMLNVELHDADGDGDTTIHSWAPRWGTEWWIRATFGPGAEF